jgi:hypothetical protein
VRVEADNLIGIHGVDQVGVDLGTERDAAVLPRSGQVRDQGGDLVSGPVGIVNPHAGRDEVIGIGTGEVKVQRGFAVHDLIGGDVAFPGGKVHFGGPGV